MRERNVRACFPNVKHFNTKCAYIYRDTYSERRRGRTSPPHTYSVYNYFKWHRTIKNKKLCATKALCCLNAKHKERIQAKKKRSSGSGPAEPATPDGGNSNHTDIVCYNVFLGSGDSSDDDALFVVTCIVSVLVGKPNAQVFSFRLLILSPSLSLAAPSLSPLPPSGPFPRPLLSSPRNQGR